MTIEQLVAQLNVVARTDYNRVYQEFEPKFAELLHRYESGPVASANFPFVNFLRNMEEFTGSRKHQIFPDAYKFVVTNKEWDVAVDIPRKDIERAGLINSVPSLNPYLQRIAEMPKMVKDHPIELAFDMLEAGDASTYGVCFDAQSLFSTTHDYGTAAGTQSNIITTGAGTTVANLITDIQNCWSRFDGFVYAQGASGNAQKRKLNKTMNRILIVAPTQLGGAFRAAMTQERLASGESNPVKGTFDLVTRPFTDANDWYMIILDDTFFRPFLFQVEKDPELDMPTAQDESARERKVYTWGAYGRYNVAYGAWFTAMMVQNS